MGMASLISVPPTAPWCSSAGGALGEMRDESLDRGAGRGAGFGAVRGGNGGVVVPLVDSAVEAEAVIVSVWAEGEAAAVVEGRNFLSSETFPMWTGNVNVTSGDFRRT